MKKRNYTITLIISIICSLVFSSCNGGEDSLENSTSIANPASVKCIEDGFKLEIRKDKSGGEFGVCINSSGDECDEWEYFRGECSL